MGVAHDGKVEDDFLGVEVPPEGSGEEQQGSQAGAQAFETHGQNHFYYTNIHKSFVSCGKRVKRWRHKPNPARSGWTGCACAPA